MEKKRKILAVVKKFNYKEAEEADDEYWANTTPEYRLKALMDLREMTYGNITNCSMIKEVTKRKRNAED